MVLRRKANGRQCRPGNSCAQPCSHTTPTATISPSPAQSPLGLGSPAALGAEGGCPHTYPTGRQGLGHSHQPPGAGLPTIPALAHLAHSPPLWSQSPSLPASDQLVSFLEVPGSISSPTLSAMSISAHSYSPGQAPSKHPSWKAEVAPDFLRPLRPGTRKPRCLLGSVARLYGG